MERSKTKVSLEQREEFNKCFDKMIALVDKTEWSKTDVKVKVAPFMDRLTKFRTYINNVAEDSEEVKAKKRELINKINRMTDEELAKIVV